MRLNVSIEEPLPKEKSDYLKSWEQFISQLEFDMYKITKTFKLL
jgi:hypothetical protein